MDKNLEKLDKEWLKSIEYYIDDAISLLGRDITLGEAQEELVDALRHKNYFVYPADERK